MRQPSRPSGAAPAPSADSSALHIPRHTLDPIQSLCPWPVTFTAGGREYEIPALPAAPWLALLMDPDATTDDVLIELVPDSADLVMDEDMDLVELSHSIIQLVSGRPWYLAIRMVLLVYDHWNVLGAEMLRRGVDANRLSLSAWLDVALLTLLQNTERKDHTMLLSQLELAPTTEEVAPEEMEMSHDQFLSLMS
jgi:hypothetical protein